jgi:catalase
MTHDTRVAAAAGTLVADSRKSQTAGLRGPLLMQDYRLMEKMAHCFGVRVASDLGIAAEAIVGEAA